MKKTLLFEPYTIKGMTLKNRVAMAPMCQYSADNDGLLQDWHRVHYISRAVGQVGMIITEATAVEPRGRISDRDLGLWNDTAITQFSELIEQVKVHDCKIGIQIAHAGRKATIRDEAIVAPSAIPLNDQLQVPLELTEPEIKGIVLAFGKSVQRAVTAGVDFVEIHAAHGYLINQFLSPLTNKRTDAYGRDRSLFLKEVVEEVVTHLPEQMPLFLRVSAEDYVEGGNHPEEICRLLDPVKHLINLIHVSSGGVIENAVINLYPGYQVAFAETIRKQLQLPVMAVGMLESPQLAEAALRNGYADLIALGRELLRNPYWPMHAAKILGEKIDWPEQYQRANV